jgi:hemerythrin-like domain-containing protein
MNAAQFQAALNTVEQDHQAVLDNVQSLKETVCLLLDPDSKDSARVLDRLREIQAYLATQFEAHMEEEETTLFPLLERYKPEGTQLVARLRREHDEIRRKRQELADCLEVAQGLEGGTPHMVILDVLGYGWDLWERLDTHAHAESGALHECLTQSLPHAVPSGAPGVVG